MALVLCPECRRQVSSSAQTCPHCGKRLRIGSGLEVWGCLVPLIVGALAFVALCWWLYAAGM